MKLTGHWDLINDLINNRLIYIPFFKPKYNEQTCIVHGVTLLTKKH